MKPSCQLQMVDKEVLIKSIWLHYVFCALHVELEQLRKGLLETLQIETFVCSYPKEFWLGQLLLMSLQNICWIVL